MTKKLHKIEKKLFLPLFQCQTLADPRAPEAVDETLREIFRTVVFQDTVKDQMLERLGFTVLIISIIL